MHRLFVAIPCPESLIDCLAPAMEGGAPGLRWVSEEQLHCTLRFIGSVERPLAEEIVAALGEVEFPSLSIRIDGVGIFDHHRRGALFARLLPRSDLAMLHQKIDRLLVHLGLPPERRAYLPHVTLARWSGGRLDAKGWAERHAGMQSAAINVDAFHLFESHLYRSGPEYRRIANYPLH